MIVKLNNVMKQKYISHWNQTLQNSQKLSFYNTIKNNSSPFTYLVLTRRNPLRKTLLKLRISCHKLRIETGRYDNIPRNERLCHFCNCNCNGRFFLVGVRENGRTLNLRYETTATKIAGKIRLKRGTRLQGRAVTLLGTGI